MAITKVTIKDFLVFKDEFAIDFCPGVNVLIGSNGTGKTTILKCLYDLKWSYVSESGDDIVDDLGENNIPIVVQFVSEPGNLVRKWGTAILDEKASNFVYIPEKDILEHAKGLLPFMETKQTGFSEIYRDVIINAMDVPTKHQSQLQHHIRNTIIDIIGGEIEYDMNAKEFITIKTDGTRIPLSNEASGFKKLGLMGLLVKCGQLAEGSILFWDEPENSLNPENIPILVDILLELSRNGVQIFLATHSEVLASYINTLCRNDDEVMFFSLYKDETSKRIQYDKDERFDILRPNSLMTEQVKLHEKEIEGVLGKWK